MRTVRQTTGIACPRCGLDDQLVLAVESLKRVTPDGFQPHTNAEFWGLDSMCYCTACNYQSTVTHFLVDEDGGQS